MMPKNYRKKLINNILNLNSNFMIIQSNLTGLKNKIKLKKLRKHHLMFLMNFREIQDSKKSSKTTKR